MTTALRFIDASVFIHAYLRPSRTLKAHEVEIKESAKKIINRVNAGEHVMMSVVHFGEISNILEDRLPLEDAFKIERAICLRENIDMAVVTQEDYIAALDEGEKHRVGLNDALAHVIMKKKAVNELYSFDRDFDQFRDIRRIKM